jgi:hypothetical protein
MGKNNGPLKMEQVRDRVLLLVRGGNTLGVALGACGITRQRLHEWRAHAAKGSKKYVEFFEAVQRATDEGEVNDVITTARAANLDTAKVSCNNCGSPMSLNGAEIAALMHEMHTAQSVKASAAAVAFQRLALRNPQKWSPRVVHTIEDEHTRLLDVAQRVLAPEVFRVLIEAYLAEGDGPPAPESPGRAGPTEPVH